MIFVFKVVFKIIDSFLHFSLIKNLDPKNYGKSTLIFVI